MIGTDILAIARMQQLYERHGERVVKKILHKDEYEDFNRVHDKARFLAKRWAAKEAISKALGTGLRSPILMPAIHIAHYQSGAPFVLFNSAAQKIIDERGVKGVSVSISDEKDYVVAFAIILK